MEQAPDEAKGLNSTLEKLISSRTVIGEPITVNDVTLVPVVDVTFGFGSGGGGQPEKDGRFLSMGTVTGARIAPRAVIVVRAGQVDVYPLSSSGPIERILDRIPALTGSIIDRIKEASERPGDDDLNREM